ncbi:hypothetical protein BHE74_00014765 [Ensete ventricosum]|nr:hypothetical protein BHE74_00014765 [Ensete ventricosum]RZR77432.1 hypothetical protein BHM03_00002501 [Ensete ventricosum]
MDFSSFVTSLGTSLIIFVVLMLAFTWLKRKPGNAVIYYPNRILRGVNPLEGRTMTRNPLAWIKEAVKASEADVIAAAGVDAAVYLVFLSSGMASTPVVFKCSRLKKSLRLWAFLLGVYWVSFVTYYVLWKSYTHVSDLRAGAKTSAVVKPEEFAVLVRDIPAAPPGKPEGTRPTNRTGFLGLVGPKVDTIDHCNEKIQELLPNLEAEQKITLKEKQQGAALVFFSSKPAAVSASQTIHAQKVDTWTVMEAPEPRQVLWTNLPKKFYERKIRSLIVYGIVFLTVCFYMIPIAFITMLGYIGILRKFLYAPFLIPLIVISFIFAYVCKQRFYLAFFHTSLEVACQGTKEIPNMESIYAAYIPPCLSTEKLEDVDQFEDAHSHSLRTTSL